MKPEASKLIVLLKSVAADVVVLAGLAALAYGFWQAWRPLGFIVVGLTMIFFGAGLSRSGAARRNR
jgi:hypothetical protein